MVDNNNNNNKYDKRYSDKIIKDMQLDVAEIKDALIGNFEKPGFISKTTERINTLEDKYQTIWWMIGIILTIVLTGSFKIFFS